jgi:predicted secreted hydrolase
MRRREWLAGLAIGLGGTGAVGVAGAVGAVSGAGGTGPAAAPANDDSAIAPGRRLRFPRDFGAHPGARTEWWYVTGWLAAAPGSAPGADPPRALLGFQITFFRSRTDVDRRHPSRFAATQLLFAHAAISDLRDPARPRLRHDERIARAGFGVAEAALDDTRLRLADWSMRREPDLDAKGHSRYVVSAASDAAAFGYDLEITSTQPVLLQGDAGFSRKGPLIEQASHYYSQPQLAVRGRVRLDDQRLAVAGTAWMDHEWSETLLADDAVGWDWIGMNLFDGRSLTAFQLRRADGSALWAGGSARPASGTTAAPTRQPAQTGQTAQTVPAMQGRSFAPDELSFKPGRIWRSPASRAAYPVEWTIDTPAGRFIVRSLFDDQELDSRGSTGSIYWEGLSDLFDTEGRRVGRGYLEMTGYAARLRL